MIVSGAKRLNYNTAALLRAADLSEGRCERLPPEKVTQLIQSVWQVMNDEFMGFTQLRCKQGVFAIMARQAIQCQTLREALIQGAHFYQTIRNDISFVFEFFTVLEADHRPMTLLNTDRFCIGIIDCSEYILLEQVPVRASHIHWLRHSQPV